jgi:branched-chain amino acid transport system substrate-binding protein
MGLTHESEAAVFVRQLRQMGVDVPVVGFTAWGVPAFTDLAPDAAVGVIAVQSFTPEDTNPIVQEFVEKYQARYGRLPSDPGQAYYDGVYAIKEVIDRVGFDKHAMRQELENFSGYVGLQGELVTDEKHNLSRFSLISEFQGDSWKIIDKF